jgi:3D (Asp-Asp-Asp) domain-containing protein
MSSGKKAYIGAIACPRDMELGVKVEIDGKEYICEDRYNKNLSRRFDIFFGYGEEAHRKALEFGVKEMSVIIKE